ncbi:Serine/arginine repetitive matrix protein 1 [Ophiocordyceps camponoti-floridani]|uniref:Chromatin modification-related protein EAF6 n=1 Tax=Ophiocordyceps camponoti-floridani TaxID=2030778 RepID=A0A8H4Q185_9HYPO|nr:Serine/arginine repetitive matrix protein 1 [Ophiocordyceps camponoti-floridani]
MASKMDARLLKSTKFPPEFNQKVDMERVNLHVMKKWITKRISEILGNEDDVVVELCFNLIEASRNPDIKSLQIQLTGFLDKDTAMFCKELWNLLLSGQSSPQGIPKELLEAKKLELKQEKMDADRAANARQSRDAPAADERENRDAKPVADAWHAQGRRGDRAFGNRNRGGHGRGPQRSPSPGPRGRDPRESFGFDSYVPPPRGRHEQTSRRHRDRSPSAEESSRSRSRSRSMSRGRGRSPPPPRRRLSPARHEHYRQRSRSPPPDSRPVRRGNDSRDRQMARRRSRSSSPGRSPAAKRRRRSSSRSVSAGRYRRRYSSSPPRSRSRRDYRDRDRSRDMYRNYRRRESSMDRRRDRRSFSPDNDYGYGHRRGRGKGRRARGRQFRRGGQDSSHRRRNSSSESSFSSIRGRSADVLEDDIRAASPKPTKSNDFAEKEKAQARVRELVERRRAQERKLAQLEDSIAHKESAYLESTPSGNIITGFENYMKGGSGAAAQRRKMGSMEQNRVFSRSSISYRPNMDSSTPGASTPTSHTPTPLSASAHQTPMPAAAIKSAPKSKRKEGDEGESYSSKKRTSFGASRK